MKKAPKALPPTPWKVSHESIIDRGDVYGVEDATGMPVIPRLNVDREIMQLAASAPDLLAMLTAIYEAEFVYGAWPEQAEIRALIVKAGGQVTT